MLIYIVRHGLTEWNKLKKLQGIADVPLAEEGILLAEKTGEALRGGGGNLTSVLQVRSQGQGRQQNVFWENVMSRSYRISGFRRLTLACWKATR